MSSFGDVAFSNVLRQQLPSHNNPFTTSIAIEALEKTRDWFDHFCKLYFESGKGKGKSKWNIEKCKGERL